MQTNNRYIKISWLPEFLFINTEIEKSLLIKWIYEIQKPHPKYTTINHSMKNVSLENGSKLIKFFLVNFINNDV